MSAASSSDGTDAPPAPGTGGGHRPPADPSPPGLGRPLLGEALGTFLLVAAGTGCVAGAVLLGVPGELWQVAAVWGVAVAVAILVSAPLSPAHLNPAVSLAFAVARPGEFAPRRMLPSWGAQFVGAVAAGALVAALFAGPLREFEVREGLVRGAPGSERAAMVFGEYFPNPGAHGTGPAAEAVIGTGGALLGEALGTAALVLVVFLLTDGTAPVRAPSRAVPWLIGGTVSCIILVLAEWTQCGINPARDWGPRCVAWAIGFDGIAFPGPRGGAWIYVAGPLLGGGAAAVGYEAMARATWRRRGVAGGVAVEALAAPGASAGSGTSAEGRRRGPPSKEGRP